MSSSVHPETFDATGMSLCDVYSANGDQELINTALYKMTHISSVALCYFIVFSLSLLSYYFCYFS